MTILQRIGAILAFLSLAACGGGSSGTGDAGLGNGSDPGTPAKNVLFVGDEGKFAFATFSTLKPAAGATIAANLLDIGPTTMWLGIAYDGVRDRLYANDSRQIAVFDQASTLKGKIAPTRAIVPLIPNLELLYGMQLDKANDQLYVGYHTSVAGPYSIAVFNNASMLTGSVAPSRVIIGIDAGHFAIDTLRNILYTRSASSIESLIDVYPSQNLINGVAPSNTRKTLRPMVNGLPSGLALDQNNDRLYVGVAGSGVAVVTDASSRAILELRDPVGTLVELIALPNNAQMNVGLAYDSNNDRLYAGFDSSVYLLDAASKLQADTPASALLITAPTGSVITTFAFP